MSPRTARRLFVVLQSAARQDGGTGGTSATRDNTRLFTYDIGEPRRDRADRRVRRAAAEVSCDNGATRVAAQSELLAVSGTQLLILPRDGNGLGLPNPTSQCTDRST